MINIYSLSPLPFEGTYQKAQESGDGKNAEGQGDPKKGEFFRKEGCC